MADPFSGRRPEDETPRFKKTRGKAEWTGRGEGFDVFESLNVTALQGAAGLPKASCVRREGFSQWARENMLRSLADAKRR